MILTSLVSDEMCADPHAWLTGSVDTAVDRALARVDLRDHLHAPKPEDIVLFDPIHGLGLSTKACSGRSWMEQPDGDPVSAHLSITCDGETVAPGARLHSGTGLFAGMISCTSLTRESPRMSGPTTHDGTRTDLPRRAEQIRSAVRSMRRGRSTRPERRD